MTHAVRSFAHGYLHEPSAPLGVALALTHGAGSDCRSRLLVAVAEAIAEIGVHVYRYDLPFRRARPNGPPSPAKAAADRAGIQEALTTLRANAGRVFAGGVSYGGRQTTLLAAEDTWLADGLLLLSYPLHAPGKPDQLRTAHFASLRNPALFAHGERDPFGSIEEMRSAVSLTAAPTRLEIIAGAGHELGRDPVATARTLAPVAAEFFHW